jgi:hypothetical protein
MSNYVPSPGATTPFFIVNQDMGGVMLKQQGAAGDHHRRHRHAAARQGMFDQRTGNRAAIWRGMSGLAALSGSAT